MIGYFPLFIVKNVISYVLWVTKLEVQIIILHPLPLKSSLCDLGVIIINYYCGIFVWLIVQDTETVFDMIFKMIINRYITNILDINQCMIKESLIVNWLIVQDTDTVFDMIFKMIINGYICWLGILSYHNHNDNIVHNRNKITRHSK